jgi:hypothetical protein
MLDNYHITGVYNILLDILLTAEGNKSSHFLQYPCYEQKTSIDLPSALVPLLYAASNSVQMAVAFLPYYLKQKQLDDTDNAYDLKTKIIQNDSFFIDGIYPHILKFLLSDAIRTSPVSSWEHKPYINQHNHGSENIFLYDSEVTHYPPYYGVNIHDLKVCDLEKNYYLVGDIQTKALNIMIDVMQSHILYGIAPYNNEYHHWQNWLYKRLNFFSNTVLAGSLNMQLPFIEHYLQAGIAPLSFYHLLYRGACVDAVIQNALCLLNIQSPNKKIAKYLNYQRVLAHTDLHILAPENNYGLHGINYLTILSVIA